MNSFEFNKIAGALLGTLVAVMGIGFVSDAIFSSHKAAKPGYELPGEEAHAAAPGASEAPAAAAEPIAVRLASADAKKGEASAKKCTACHKFEKDGKNGVGPALWGIVERAKGSGAGFNYSAGMKAKGGNWTYEDLDQFIANPKGFVQGTLMAFAGVPNPKERGDLIAYLRSLSDNPAPLPK